MSKSKIELFSRLLRELEVEIGTRDLNKLVLQALADSVKSLQVETAEEFCNEFGKLLHVIANTEPRFGILNYNFAKLSQEFGAEICGKEFNAKKWKKIAGRRIKDLLKSAKCNKKLILKNAEKIDVEGKTILVHDHSHTVQDVLAHFKRMGKKFRVVIAEQDIEKTHDNIDRLHCLGVPFYVVPAYMLSHVHDQIDMLFFGALTLKDTMHFVMDPGTHGTISEFNLEKIPVYMFIDTLKFSLWKSKKRTEVFIHKHSRAHHMSQKEYDRVKYSHDRVPAELFKKVVTNEGVFTADKLKKVFQEKFEAHKKMMKACDR